MILIYWNTKKLKDLDRLVDILEDKKPDVLFLSEIDKGFLETNETALFKSGYEHFENPGCKRVSIIKKLDLAMELRLQNPYYTIIRDVLSDLNIVSIHLPSQMFEHMKGLKEFIRDFRATLDTEIGSSLDKKIVVIGDFNINPHEEGMIDFDGFRATNSTKARHIITHKKKKQTTYYNPTWQLYARKHFPGTKVFNRPSGSAYDVLEHHFLDQVVISQNLLACLDTDNIEVIENTSKFVFFNESSNSIEGSDHLPLLYKFKLK